MRIINENDDLKVFAVSGTDVVSLAFNLPEEKCEGLRGFSILRTDKKTGEQKYLEGMKAFAETDPGLPAGSLYSTDEHPIQGFQWADYDAVPGDQYTYEVSALKGEPSALEVFAQTAVEITTEFPEGGEGDIYFNCGVAASQQYVRQFGDKKPKEVGEEAFAWLSRGLYEALTDYIDTAESGDELYVAAYEFHYEPLLKKFREANKKGVKVKIIYDALDVDGPKEKNRKAVANQKIKGLCSERTANPNVISHNKFIIKVKDSEPVSVWTGSTNFSDGGIFGHSNVGHVSELPEVAAAYLEYWKLLKKDLPQDEMRAAVEQLSLLPDADNIPEGTTPIFSPRESLDALNLYAEMAMNAKDAIFMTFAFGINPTFQNVYATSQAPLRMALLEKKIRPMGSKTQVQIAKRAAEEKKIDDLRALDQNIFAIGAIIEDNELAGWAQEQLSGLNRNVRYVHNKFAILDPLSDDPIVIAGSANFSNASTTGNDENMLITRGSTRVADCYLTQYMRVYRHHAFRESLQWRKPDEPAHPLSLDDWWKESFGDTSQSRRRKYFAQVPV